MKKPSSSFATAYGSRPVGSKGYISLIGMLFLIALVALATSFYFYQKNKYEAAHPLNPSTSHVDQSPSYATTSNVGIDESEGPNPTDGTNDATRYAQKCGLKVMFPTIGTTVSFPLPVKGIVDNRNYNSIGCAWGVFEGQAGDATLYANVKNTGWKKVGQWKQGGQAYDSQPLMLNGDWMTIGPIPFDLLVNIDPKFANMPKGTPLKIVFEEDDPSGKGQRDMLELPFVYSGEAVPTMTITLQAPVWSDSDNCNATQPVQKTVLKTTAVADASMRALIDGYFTALQGTYNGVVIKDGVAIVDFDKKALSTLNSAICMQASVKTPIEKTLKQFPTIKSVKYSIDGEIFTEWDA